MSRETPLSPARGRPTIDESPSGRGSGPVRGSWRDRPDPDYIRSTRPCPRKNPAWRVDRGEHPAERAIPAGQGGKVTWSGSLDLLSNHTSSRNLLARSHASGVAPKARASRYNRVHSTPTAAVR